MIPEEDLSRLRQAIDFVQVASEYTALKKQGQRWVGLCPFHSEKTPSFSINAQEKLYHCFGCQASGDVITFIRELEHLDFVSAVERLAQKAGIHISYEEDADFALVRKERKSLLDLMTRAAEWYHENLLSHPQAGLARDYLRSRGYDGTLVRRFKLGWALDNWDGLVKALNIDADLLVKARLGFVNKTGRLQDSFRSRIMFPIFDISGQPIAFGGRSLPNQNTNALGGISKYKNSAESSLYSKKKVLYGLNWAKNAIVRQDLAVVCEGYTDVMGFYTAGVENSVATCGTALGEEHIKVLSGFAHKIVLAYDSDTAGQSAIERFYEWEKKYSLDISVAVLPPGQDPGSLAAKDPQTLSLAVKNSEPFLLFRLKRVFEKYNLSTAEGRAKAARAGLSLIDQYPDPIVKDLYLMQIADMSQLDPNVLRSQISTKGQNFSNSHTFLKKRPVLTTAKPTTALPMVELIALRIAINRPEEVMDLEEFLFSNELTHACYIALASHQDIHAAIGDSDPEVSKLLSKLAVEDDKGETGREIIARLVERAVLKELSKFEMKARRSNSLSVDMVAEFSWLKLSLEKIRQDDYSQDLLKSLLQWLHKFNSN